MPVWCRYHGFAHTQCISERTGNNLRLIQVRRDVNISCANKFQQILIRHKVIVKNNMVLNTQFFGAQVKPKSVILSLLSFKVRMGGTDDHVYNIRVVFYYFW